MTEEQRTAIQTTVDYLDDLMQAGPNTELANVSNYLQRKLNEEA